jgi:hypothetical protein
MDFINKIAYIEEKTSEEQRVQAVACGARSHIRECEGLPPQGVLLNGKTSFLPMHSKELKKGTAEGIRKQLGLK